MVSTSMFVALIASMLFAIGLPIVLVVLFKKKFGISLYVLLIGMATFLVFALILENIPHTYFLVGNATTKEWLENPWLYMLYGGLMAGLFEETGRLIMMKYVLKKYRDWKDGLSFGLGHGGFEAAVLVGISSISTLVMAIMINNGSFDSLASMEPSLQMAKDQLTGSSALVWLGGIERVSALAIQLGLSILVMYGVKNRKIIFYFLAILIHAIIDFPAALYQTGTIENILFVEIVYALVAVIAIVWIVKSRRLYKEAVPKV
ncbi:YhfC family intramembrane metalloprotease [Bacillus sp. SD088]|uniref:YhfC family intramembrane metalloprotease n=1 Tax=Bacillus sp. SD088 TaxID=2782012 RepID=UPI001F60E18F|nr:YhfC family intramembrane metalloprotease [Bacillus sp. SD088]